MVIFRPLVRQQLADLRQHLETLESPTREDDCVIAYGLGLDWINPRFEGSWRQHIETHGVACAWLNDHVFNASGGEIPRFGQSLDVVYKYIDDLMKADGIRVSRDPSGVGAEVSYWRLTKKRYQFPKATGYHSHETIALLMALVGCLIQTVDGEPEE